MGELRLLSFARARACGNAPACASRALSAIIGPAYANRLVREEWRGFLPRARGASAQPADRLRQGSIALVFASIVVVGVLAGFADSNFAAGGSAPFAQFIAAGMLTSAVAETRPKLQRMGDGLGAVGLVTLCGIANGFISLLGLHLHFATVDQTLFKIDAAFGLDGSALAAFVSHLPHLFHRLIGAAYTYTVQVILVSLIVQASRGERVEVWRAAFCFAGCLLTVCLVSIFTPAKGLGLWLSASTLEHLPPGATRYFWPAFDLHYQGVAKLIRIDSIGAVVSFPSFHIIMGLIALTLWRTKRAVFPLALAWFAAMLPATLVIGGHYFVDLIAGILVWVIWFALSLRIAPATERQTQQQSTTLRRQGFDSN